MTSCAGTARLGGIRSRFLAPNTRFRKHAEGLKRNSNLHVVQ